MKRILSAVLAVGLLAAGPVAVRVRAAEGAKDLKDEADHHEEMLKEKLSLSDDQASKLKSAWEAEKAAVKPLFKEAKENHRRLEEQVRGLASDKEIQVTLDQMDAVRKAMTAEHQKLEATLASVLKPYQRAKLHLLMAEHMKKHGGMGGHGRGEGERWGGHDGHDGHEGRGDRDEDGDEPPHDD
jgi:Spy/CpxP family protein refolding chaperone